jgi:DNA-binding protein HU-beta
MAAQLAEKVGIPQIKAAALLNHIFDADTGIIAEAIVGGDKVLLAGFGTWEPRTRKGRVGTNPATKAKMEIASKKYVAFKAGKTLKERILA